MEITPPWFKRKPQQPLSPCKGASEVPTFPLPQINILLISTQRLASWVSSFEP